MMIVLKWRCERESEGEDESLESLEHVSEEHGIIQLVFGRASAFSSPPSAGIRRTGRYSCDFSPIARHRHPQRTNEWPGSCGVRSQLSWTLFVFCIILLLFFPLCLRYLVSIEPTTIYEVPTYGKIPLFYISASCPPRLTFRSPSGPPFCLFYIFFEVYSL